MPVCGQGLCINVCELSPIVPGCPPNMRQSQLKERMDTEYNGRLCSSSNTEGSLHNPIINLQVLHDPQRNNTHSVHVEILDF